MNMLIGTTDTSREALKAIEPQLPRWQDVVLDTLLESEGGMTCREIAFAIHKESGFVSARLRELEDDGRISRSGAKRKDHFTEVDAYVWRAGVKRPSFAGFLKYLTEKRLGNSDFSPKRRAELYRQYVKSI